ncbi:MAG: sporulation membrane protein YtaF [Firmicutes bacterium]|nr:sporulation membrane protein YtaF [Bacillota bacterium]
MSILQIFIEALLLSSACSVDSLITGFAYGVNKVKIPFVSALIINIICSAALTVSLFCGSLVGGIIPDAVTTAVCASVLVLLGVIKIFGPFFKKRSKKGNTVAEGQDGGAQDVDGFCGSQKRGKSGLEAQNKLSLAGAVLLALALSVDGTAVGFGAGIANPNAVHYVAVACLSLATGMAFLLFGRFLGGKIAKRTSLNLSWLSGILFIGLAMMKIFL